MGKTKHFKDLLRTFVGQTSEEAQEREETQKPVEEVQAKEIQTPADPPGRAKDENSRPIKGSLLQVWEKWAGACMPPMLSLTACLPQNRIELDHQQLERENVRITVQLEQDAKRRLKEIAEAEEKARVRAEARAKAMAEAGESGKLEEEEDEISLDARCHVYLSKDKMVCWAFLFPPVGTGTLPLDAMGKAMTGAGVTTGICTEMLLRVFQEKPYFELIPVAIGTPVVEGTNGSVRELYARELPPEIRINEDGLADYKFTNYVRQVNKDDVICEISLPVEGQSGLKVDGTVVAPKPVRRAKVPKGANTVVTEDGLKLLSTIDGHLEYRNDLFHVRPVLTVEGDVDYTVGNIDFTGDVHVKGDVRENFKITATGTVTIDGLVEAATVEAGSDLVITRGVVGDNRAMLRSGGCVRVKYLESCVVYAGKGVFADCVMNSQIFSDTTIEVVTGRGSVIGGALTAAKSVKAKMIGAQSGRRTEITLGVLPYVQRELQDIDRDIKANRREWEELDKTLTYLERENGLEGSDARFAKARMRRAVLEMREQQLIKRRERLEPLVPDVKGCMLECDMVYPVTRLVVQEAVWMAREVKKHCKVRYYPQTEELKEVY